MAALVVTSSQQREDFTALAQSMANYMAQSIAMIGGLDAKVTGHDARFTGLEARFDQLDAEIRDIKADVREIKDRPK